MFIITIHVIINLVRCLKLPKYYDRGCKWKNVIDIWVLLDLLLNNQNSINKFCKVVVLNHFLRLKSRNKRKFVTSFVRVTNLKILTEKTHSQMKLKSIGKV